MKSIGKGGVSTADIGDRSSEGLVSISHNEVSQPPTLAIGLQREES